MISRFIKLSLLAHERLIRYVHPAGASSDEDAREAAGRFVSLVVLASFLIPLFIFQFANSGYPFASMMMLLTGAIMLASVWVYRYFGRLWIARDLFLGALYVFVTWETFFFDSVYSPGMIWYAAMPVASVLLGSFRAGGVWLAINCLSAATSAILISDTSNHAFLIGGYELLYVFSVCCLAIAIFIFILMIDAARARAYRSLREANEAVRIKAETDELTGLCNRRTFQETLSSRVLNDDRLAVMILDLDGFKDVNDSHGHDLGDELIKRIAAGLQDLVQRRAGIVARIGGDEFAVLLWGEAASAEAEQLAGDALRLVRNPVSIDGRTCAVGVSIGISVAKEATAAAELIRRADVAMYDAKKGGKNRSSVYSPSMDCTRTKRMMLAQQLAVTLEQDAIEVHFQPIIDSKNRQILAVEALARWSDADGNAVSPTEFIAAAEETGMINRLGLQVLRKACQAAKQWPGLRLSVNLSPVQFRSPTLVRDIRRILGESGLPADRLELEVTESYLIEHPEQAQPVLAELQSMGIKIALDDFGTGYSSIGYLREYKFDRLKIDRSLVSGVSNDPASQSIIQATALLARSLSMKVTAEGVETEQEAQLLHLAGCNNLQGYLFGKPQMAASISALIGKDGTREQAA